MKVLILLAVLLGVGAFWFLSAPKPAKRYDAEWYDDADEVPEPPQPEPAFKLGCLYRIDPIIDLAWSCGYTQQEVDDMWRSARIFLFCNGVKAEFQHYGHYDAQREMLWECFAFDPNADTSSVDRWRRTPTDVERKEALWRGK